jgi:hypothetical protein
MKNLLLIIGLVILQAGCTSTGNSVKRAPLLTFAELDAEISISRERLDETSDELADMDSVVAVRQAGHPAE